MYEKAVYALNSILLSAVNINSRNSELGAANYAIIYLCVAMVIEGVSNVCEGGRH